ncbi:hypothetical protein PJ985_05150 [Streptomyces sp. ACA25]|uniref:hypothetical protein n=1 Tax=Streptomyces sp. ACA25 TaxID=3022596 RepID=UPI002307312F|nr:hypothetical protein [Streptomyces sp. ACA25]MDB1086951.1 hypothetical protein [Streptomyces sp. ACA25]
MAIAVTSADLVLPATDRHTPGAHVLTSPRQQDFPSALNEARQLLDRFGSYLVVYPSTTPLPYVQRLHAVRALLESDRIALLPSSLPPLGTALLIRQLRQLSSCDFGPGVLGSAARLLTHYIYTGALLASGRAAARTPVPLPPGHGARPPSGQCAVLAGPTPQLIRTAGEGTLTGPQFGTLLTYAQSGGLSHHWVTGRLARQWQVQGTDAVPLPAESTDWWGTSRLVEFAAAIPDVSLLHQMVSSVRQERCHWCSLALIGDRCAFCSATVIPASERRLHAIPAATARRALT